MAIAEEEIVQQPVKVKNKKQKKIKNKLPNSYLLRELARQLDTQKIIGVELRYRSPNNNHVIQEVALLPADVELPRAKNGTGLTGLITFTVHTTDGDVNFGPQRLNA